MALRGLKRVTLGFFLLIILTSLLNGCVTSPTVTYANVNDSYIATVEVLIDAQVAGKISDEDWLEDVLPLINFGDSLLDTYWEAVQAGLEGEGTLNQITEVTRKLGDFLIERQLAQDG